MRASDVLPLHPAVESTGRILLALREKTPLVQCITNNVVTNFTANVLLALGASPAMVDIPEEAGDFAAVASSLLINVGTPHAEQVAAMKIAAEAAFQHGTPWVLDPVAVGFLKVRTATAHELLQHQPNIVRGNASEILALARTGAGGRGTDAIDSAESALPAIPVLSVNGAAIAVSGPVDIIGDTSGVLRLNNGSELLTRVTGGGCALGAVMAACLAVAESNYDAAVAATAIYTVAAELAAETAHGPGSFAVNFIDSLASLDVETLHQRMNCA